MKWIIFILGICFVVGCGASIDERFQSYIDQVQEDEGIPRESEVEMPSGKGESEEENAESLPSVERLRPETLVINEILYDIPGSDTNGQLFVELMGTAGGDVTDYSLNFINGDGGKVTKSILFPQDTLIPEDGLLVIADAKTGSGDETFIEGADMIDNFDPQNGPDCLQLLDEAGELLDALGYGSPIAPLAENGLPCVEGFPAEDPPSGMSLSRMSGLDADDNSLDFSPLDSPTPGME